MSVLETTQSKIASLYSQKARYSNYFNQRLEDAEFFQTETTVVLRVPCQGFHRVYFLSTNKEELCGILRSLPAINVVNLPSKGSIAVFDEVMTLSGYTALGRYERYYNTAIKRRGTTEPTFATLEDLDAVYSLFHAHFSPYIDYLPERSELGQLIENNQVIVNLESGHLVGAFVFAFEGKKCYFRAWIDHGTQGLKLLFDAYNIMVSRGYSYAYFWVNSTNEQVKSIHRLFGAQADGLNDYTYIKE